MAGGIQKGTEAGSEESKQLDGDIKVVSEAIDMAQSVYYREEGHTNYTAPRFSESTKQAAALPELKEMGITVGCVPDGGMWFDGPRTKLGRLIKAAFEAKHQQDGGNAIERWFKNAFVLNAINPKTNYVTFTCGNGATTNTPIGRTLAIAVFENGEHHFNKYREGKASVFLSVGGYTDDEVRVIMKKALGV